jgi:hypothetical protein
MNEHDIKVEYVQKVHELVCEFETEGFVKTPHNKNAVLNRLRSQHAEHLRIFRAGCNNSVGKACAKYGVYDVFGNKICYYYDIRKKDKFVNLLVEIFYEKNPNPGVEIRKVFTRLLHLHRLHWFGCCHAGKDIRDTRLVLEIK